MSIELTSNPDELQRNFFELKTPQDVAAILEIEYRKLQQLDQVSPEENYRTFYIPKRSGGMRRITAPIPSLRNIQSRLNQVLQLIYKPRVSTHGFVLSKSIVTNAQVHTGISNKWILNIDVKDFFTSIQSEKIQQMFMGAPYNLNESVASVLIKICCFNNCLPQGAPTSPVISNMFCVNMDNQLDDLAYKCRSIYTRYADDMTFSASTTVSLPKDLVIMDDLNKVRVGNKLANVIHENGFEINLSKVRIQISPQRQEVTGLVVNGEKPNMKRTFVRQIRAMLHAWEKFGLNAAEEKYLESYADKPLNPWRRPSSFERVVRGKIEFLGMVRGKDDALYLKLLGKLERLRGLGKARSLNKEDSSKVDSDLAKKKSIDETSLADSMPASFKVTLLPIDKQKFHVHSYDSLLGKGSEISNLPYTSEELTAILKALPFENVQEAGLTSSQYEALRRLGFIDKEKLIFLPDWDDKLGVTLFDTLFPGEIGERVKTTLAILFSRKRALEIMIGFSTDTVELSRYPWELIKTRKSQQSLVLNGAVNLARNIENFTPFRNFAPVDRLSILYIESRPSNLTELPKGKEQNVISKAFAQLEQEGIVSINKLSPATFESLTDQIKKTKDTIVHFDGHGTVSRRCKSCGSMNYAHHTFCQKKGCGFSIDNITPRGYLAFECATPDRTVEWIDSRELGNLFSNSRFGLAIVSACRSGEVRGESIFSSVGPSLTEAGIPAVVSMQMPITVSAAIQFMRGFYEALARSEPLSSAIQSGRLNLLRGREWFIPVLYWQGKESGLPFLKKRWLK